MKLHFIVFTGLVFLSLFGCSGPENLALTILDRQPLNGVPSASGIERVGNDIYVVGDNTPWMYKLDEQFGVAGKLQIASYLPVAGDIFTKENKPDFEGIASVSRAGENELWVFGSGSKSPERDVLTCINYVKNDAATSYSLEQLYSGIISSANIGRDDLNIEGAAAVDDKLYLFNRGGNRVLQYNLKDFFGYLEGKTESPIPVVYKIRLPEINEIEAGLSGATVMPDGHQIIFTASIENTSNWIDDGEILGSYVGIIEIKDLKDQYQPRCAPVMKDNEILKVKVESVTVLPVTTPHEFDLLLVTDSDGGQSEIIKASLNFENKGI